LHEIAHNPETPHDIRAEAAGFLIAKGAGVNLLTSKGVSALDNAIDFGLTDVTEKLKNAGAKCGTSYAYSLNCKRVEGQN
jgi:ankyrin repeat protein